MAVVLYRSNRTEELVSRLCEALAQGAPDDPFVPVPIVVGSRGMERWLRHEIATRRGVTGRLDFPFPRQAFDGAAAWLLDGDSASNGAFWEASLQKEAVWAPDALAFRTLPLLRAHLDDAAFGRVARYLDGRAQGPIGPRELAFAREVADVLDRLLHDRPEDALAWAEDPSSAPSEHAWLAMLLQELQAASDERSPARLQLRLRTSRLPKTESSLYLFGLSTLGPGDRARLGWLARAMDVHIFLLAPSQVWWADVRSKWEKSRAQAAATDAASQQGLELELANENPLLSVLGMPSRDIQTWLEELDEGYREADTLALDASAPEQGSLLTRLQAWVSRAEGLADAAPWPRDDSISFHGSYGPLRQCEVLRDELLALFAADDRLEPRHVCVMTPDIETYAPLVSAVFARRGLAALPDGSQGSLPSIPTAVSDLGLRRTNPVAEVLLKLLELTGERLTVGRLLDFLSLEALRERFSLSADDLADLRALVRQSHMCWGLDARDRGRFDQPERDQNTVRFALERLALGVLMPDEGASMGQTVPSIDSDLGPAVPLPVESRERVVRIGKLARVVRQIVRAQERFATPRPMAKWRALLGESLDTLTGTTAKGAWLRAEIDESLDELVKAAGALEDLLVDREALMRWLRDRFEIPQRGDRPITGAVTVCALEPMRSVPFEVVVLLGMDDGAFPRGSQPRAWDPFSEVKRGERDRRAVDRHLLLEALLSARKRFMVLWSGRDIHTGEALPPAVPIEELIEILGRLTGSCREELVRQSALQPWSPRNFNAEDGPRSFDARMGEAARRTVRIAIGRDFARARGLPASGAKELPPESEPPMSITLQELARGLQRPQKMLLSDRLGLRLETKEDQLPDREPIELDDLDVWQLGDRVLPAVLGGDSLDDTWVARFRDRLAGEGVLPLQAGGERVLTRVLKTARSVKTNLDAVGGEILDTTQNVHVVLPDGTELTGNIARLRRKEGRLLFEWLTPSKEPNERLRMLAWVHVLAAAANELPVAGARLVGAKPKGKKANVAGQLLAWSGTASDARERLAELTAIWRRGRLKPLELFPTVSPRLAEILDAGEDLSDPGLGRKAVSEIRTAWEGGFRSRGDRQDTWIAPCFPDYDPTLRLFEEAEEGLVDLARRVWLPVKQAARESQSLANEWAEEEASK